VRPHRRWMPRGWRRGPPASPSFQTPPPPPNDKRMTSTLMACSAACWSSTTRTSGTLTPAAGAGAARRRLPRGRVRHRNGNKGATEEEGKNRTELMIFHLSMVLVVNLPQLHEIWIWWSTCEVLHENHGVGVCSTFFFRADPRWSC
jgi:hypothetical protein